MLGELLLTFVLMLGGHAMADALLQPPIINLNKHRADAPHT